MDNNIERTSEKIYLGMAALSRGATWKNSELRCNNKNHGWLGRKRFNNETQAKVHSDKFENEPNDKITPNDFTQVKPCWDNESSETESWRGVTLKEFLNCDYNLAANRQVRMLADLSDAEINCYSNIFPVDNNPNYNSTMNKILESAKKNLRDRISFFTLTEFQRLSQYLFEKTFKRNFDVKFVLKSSTVAGSFMSGDNEAEKISDEDVKKIKELNKYDIELYNYAKELFVERIKYFRREDCRLAKEQKFPNQTEFIKNNC